jgi:hypothetical protein
LRVNELIRLETGNDGDTMTWWWAVEIEIFRGT